MDSIWIVSMLLAAALILLLTMVGYFCYTLDRRVRALEDRDVRPVSFGLPIPPRSEILAFNKLLDPVVPSRKETHII